jgi:rhamnose transport system permease protein
MIGNALPIMAISPFWQMLISGAVILAAVMLNRQRGRAAKIILHPKPVESAR